MGRQMLIEFLLCPRLECIHWTATALQGIKQHIDMFFVGSYS